MKNLEWINKKKNTKDFKGWVGDPKQYENIAIIIFTLLKSLGLKQTDRFLDIGCGSLRIGRLLIHYLKENCYYGIEPEKWLIEESIKNILTDKYIEDKGVKFSHNKTFNLQCFNKKFDFIMANSIFIHACKSQIEKCFEKIDLTLKQKGKFLFNFFLGNKDNEENEWSYPHAVCYTNKFFIDLIEKYNFNHKIVECNYPGKQIFVLCWRNK